MEIDYAKPLEGNKEKQNQIQSQIKDRLDSEMRQSPHLSVTYANVVFSAEIFFDEIDTVIDALKEIKEEVDNQE